MTKEESKHHLELYAQLQSENERMKAEIAKLPKLDKGDKIKLYGKETEVIGFNVAWNEGLFDYEIILLTEGRGDPFKRSLDSIEILPQPPKQPPKKPICCEKYMRCQDCPSSPNYINPLTNNKQ